MWSEGGVEQWDGQLGGQPGVPALSLITQMKSGRPFNASVYLGSLQNRSGEELDLMIASSSSFL